MRHMIRSLKINTTIVEGMKLLLRTIPLSLFASFSALLSATCSRLFCYSNDESR